MSNIFKLIILTINLIFITNCSEKVSYSGKILNNNNFEYSQLENKEQVIKKIGRPNFIDPIENKFYYYSEKTVSKNFFNTKVENSTMLVFNFNLDGKIININQFNLNDQKDINYIKEKTSNELIKTGLLKKIFGGVGKAPLSNTPE